MTDLIVASQTNQCRKLKARAGQRLIPDPAPREISGWANSSLGTARSLGRFYQGAAERLTGRP